MSESWNELKQECLSCKKCPLWETRTNVVFGCGSEHAEILLIGEGPGANEDQQGIPFVGRAGQLLDTMMEIIGLNRDSVFIANIVKCRPPQNRDPLPTEEAACTGYLHRQIALLQPKIIVCLGRIAAQHFIRPDFKIMQEHGIFYDVNGIPTMAILHPAALLRDPGKKPLAFSDLKNLQAKIHEVCTHTNCR